MSDSNFRLLSKELKEMTNGVFSLERFCKIRGNLRILIFLSSTRGGIRYNYLERICGLPAPTFKKSLDYLKKNNFIRKRKKKFTEPRKEIGHVYELTKNGWELMRVMEALIGGISRMGNSRGQAILRNKQVIIELKPFQKLVNDNNIKILDKVQDIFRVKGTLSIVYVLGELGNLKPRLSYIANFSHLVLPTTQKALRHLVRKKVVKVTHFYFEYPRKEKVKVYTLTKLGKELRKKWLSTLKE